MAEKSYHLPCPSAIRATTPHLMLNLTAYMDEAGHSDDPRREYVGMACFVAPYGTWEVFIEQWLDTLKKADLSEPFHMMDYAFFKGQFKGWNEEQRQILLRRLMEIIINTKATPVGAVVSVKDFRGLTSDQQSSFRNPYYVAFQQCTRGAAIEASYLPPEEKVRMVYAAQSEYGGLAKGLWNEMQLSTDWGTRMGSYTVSTPDTDVPLQAADLFAYELLKDFENRIKKPNLPMRWV